METLWPVKVTTVNITEFGAAMNTSSNERPYHHGDLKAALLAAARQRVAESGADSLSLRDIARQAQVSHAATYRHFPDKRSLLSEVAAQGFRELVAANQSAMATAPKGPVEQLLACGVSYVEFGRRHAHLLQLMFGSQVSVEPLLPELADAGRESYEQLLGLVEAGQQNRAFRPGPSAELALACWSHVHGLAMLLAAGRVPGIGANQKWIRRLIERSVGLLIDGLR